MEELLQVTRTLPRIVEAVSIAVAVAVSIAVPIAFFLLFERWFLVLLPKGPLEAALGF